MLQALIQLLLYALLAGFSALALAATIGVMQAGRLKALDGPLSSTVVDLSVVFSYGVSAGS